MTEADIPKLINLSAYEVLMKSQLPLTYQSVSLHRVPDWCTRCSRNIDINNQRDLFSGKKKTTYGGGHYSA